MKIKLIIIFTLIISYCISQNTHKISVYFRHGSKPYREYKKTIRKEDGGFFGGHVSLVLDSIEYGFTCDKKINIFPKPKTSCGFYYCEELKNFQQDTIGLKYTIIEIPIKDSQYVKLKTILERYLSRTPYCYAFFGMRCASATYEILSQINILPIKSQFRNIISNFYPRLLRKKMKKLAKKNHYKLIRHNGRKTRIWEDDD